MEEKGKVIFLSLTPHLSFSLSLSLLRAQSIDHTRYREIINIHTVFPLKTTTVRKRVWRNGNTGKVPFHTLFRKTGFQIDDAVRSIKTKN